MDIKELVTEIALVADGLHVDPKCRDVELCTRFLAACKQIAVDAAAECNALRSDRDSQQRVCMAAMAREAKLREAMLSDSALAGRFHKLLAIPADDSALKAALKAERERICGLYSPDDTAKPVAWIRFCSDGCYEGPIMDEQIEDVRKNSGAWTPLYARHNA